MIVAAESAYFLLAFVNIGLVPDGGSSLFVPTRVGMARATELAMLGERLPAPQALRVGADQPRRARRALAEEAAALAARLAAGPTRSYAGTKRQLNNWLYARMDEQLELEAQIQREMAGKRRLPGGRDGVRGEAPGAVLGRVGDARADLAAAGSEPVQRALQPHRASGKRHQARPVRALNRIPRALGHHVLPTTLAFFTPESGGSPNANKID